MQSRLQAIRKEMNLGFTQRVTVTDWGARAVRVLGNAAAQSSLKTDVLIDSLVLADQPPEGAREYEIDGEAPAS